MRLSAITMCALISCATFVIGLRPPSLRELWPFRHRPRVASTGHGATVRGFECDGLSRLACSRMSP